MQRRLTYTAGSRTSPVLELSSALPQGMSGAPVYIPRYPPLVVGLALGTVESEVVVHAVEEFESNGIRERERVSRIIQYGIALELVAVSEWLRSQLIG